MEPPPNIRQLDKRFLIKAGCAVCDCSRASCVACALAASAITRSAHVARSGCDSHGLKWLSRGTECTFKPCLHPEFLRLLR